MINPVNSILDWQRELIDAKVEVAVSRAITPVLEHITSLRHDMHREIGGLRQEMHQEMGDLRQTMSDLHKDVGGRLSAVETELGLRRETRRQVRAHFLNVSFKLGWVVAIAILSGASSMLALYGHRLLS